MDAPTLRSGKTWEELPVGFRFQTTGRTITDADLSYFIGMYGYNDSLFFDTIASAAMGHDRRLVPAALTYVMAEGLVMQTGIMEGTGIAFLGMAFDVSGPVYAGDTIHAVIEVTESRVTSRGDRAVVTSANHVLNQAGETVLTYRPVRLMRGAEPSQASSGRST